MQAHNESVGRKDDEYEITGINICELDDHSHINVCFTDIPEFKVERLDV